MSDKRDIADSIQKLAGTYMKDIVAIQSCTVDSVDKDNRVCDCIPIGGDATTNIPGVQLCAENNNGLVVFPKVGSTVIVAQSVRNNTFVLMFSDVESIQFMDGTYGGLTKTQELKTQIDKLNAQLQAIITAVTTWVVVPNDGGAALKAAAVAGMVGKPAGVFTGIENPLVTHGNV